jgi:NADP-reducing hydrogenase subunit HndD
MPSLMIDNKSVQVAEGTNLLEAARQAGVHIPTLCYLEKVQAVGSCRVCLVEVEGAKTLLASCVTPATEGMKVHTNSKRVREARRQVVELILSDHDGDCQLCNRNGDCELQAVARELGIREITYAGAKSRRFTDSSTPALVRETGKCISCRRCVTVCSQTQGVAAIFPQGRGFNSVIGPAFTSELGDVVCVQCGQCSAVCPVGAISEKDNIDLVWQALDDPKKHVVVQTAPAIRAALGECFGYPPGTLVTGKMVTALRMLGFDKVFDTNFSPASGRPWWRRSRWPCPCSPAALRAGSASPSTSTRTSCPTSPPARARSRCSARWPRPTTPRRRASLRRTSWWSP